METLPRFFSFLKNQNIFSKCQKKRQSQTLGADTLRAGTFSCLHLCSGTRVIQIDLHHEVLWISTCFCPVSALQLVWQSNGKRYVCPSPQKHPPLGLLVVCFIFLFWPEMCKEKRRKSKLKLGNKDMHFQEKSLFCNFRQILAFWSQIQGKRDAPLVKGFPTAIEGESMSVFITEFATIHFFTIQLFTCCEVATGFDLKLFCLLRHTPFSLKRSWPTSASPRRAPTPSMQH